ncbi:response regulator transcription factor [Cohnella sp. JJ-181]|uniref:response regulator transcription factor n=1 Tax=Cohnella rhizoplanae TaxID=2974897 RepID=UPI0022FF5E39|nr:response regulator [Cohnella sp. JJ-181]CAI6062731.1 HTH-type transcriptional activator RhaR [Cohnella sp. JJ-181]
MYTIILVDDERLTLDTLANYTDWERMSCRVIATANNGRDALKKIEAMQPDILITDVKMPVMDGIELCKQVHARFPHIQIVFLSGYNEFEYACAALQHGACGYLLKPIDNEELAATMKMVRQRCEEQKNRLHSTVLTAGEYLRELLQIGGNLLSGLADEVTSIYNRYLHLPAENKTFYFVFISMDEYMLLADKPLAIDAPPGDFSTAERLEFFIAGLPSFFPGVLTKLRDGQWIFVTQQSDSNAFTEWRNQSAHAQRWISLFLTNDPQTLLSFTKNWPQMLKVRNHLVATHGTGLISDSWENMNSTWRKEPFPPTKRLIAAVQQNRRDQVEEWLNDFYDGGLPPGNISQVFVDTISAFDSVLSAIGANNRHLQEIIEKDSKFFGRLSLMESMPSMKTHMRQILSIMMDELEASPADRHIEIVQELCSIIQKNYGQVISIDALAELVFLSPNYLRTIFKDITGKTLLEYVTQVRMDHACIMLQETNIRIHEIAKRVGFESPSYFGSIFFKRTGLTPNQYRTHAKKRQPT